MGMDACMLCPRMCGVDRESGEKGYCGNDGKLRAARAALHMWEEPCISGTRGLVLYFFPAAVCGVFSARIMKSHKETVPGRFPWDRLSEIFLELQEKGAANINLVTATHFAPACDRSTEKGKSTGNVSAGDLQFQWL